MATMNNVYSELGLGERPKVSNYSPQMVECFTTALDGIRVKLDEGTRDYPGDPFSTAIVLGEILYLRHVRKQDWSRLGDEDLMRLTSLGRYQVRVAIGGLRALGLIEVHQKSRRSPRDIRLLEEALKDLVVDPRARALRANESARSARAESARSARAESARSARAIEEDLDLDLEPPLTRGEGDDDPNFQTETGSDEPGEQSIVRAKLAEHLVDGKPLPQWAIEEAIRRHNAHHASGAADRDPKHRCWGFTKYAAEDALLSEEARALALGTIPGVDAAARAERIAGRATCSACDENGHVHDWEERQSLRCEHTDDEKRLFRNGEPIQELEQG